MTITATRPASGPLAADDPRHGTVAGRSAGCTCFACRCARSAWRTARHRRIGYGTWKPWVDAQPVREHLRQLSDYGIGWERVATLAGLPGATVGAFLYARGNNRSGPVTKCRARTAEAILAVQPILANVADTIPIDDPGTIRRLRALVALGHTAQSLGDRLPMHSEAARRTINRGGRVTARVARATRTLYADLSAMRPEGWVADRARHQAAAKGWVVPAAWDDDTIDDPDATPNLGGDDTDVVDVVAARRALEGERVPLNDAERAAAVRIGVDRGMTVGAIATVLRISHHRATRLLNTA